MELTVCVLLLLALLWLAFSLHRIERESSQLRASWGCNCGHPYCTRCGEFDANETHVLTEDQVWVEFELDGPTETQTEKTARLNIINELF